MLSCFTCFFGKSPQGNKTLNHWLWLWTESMLWTMVYYVGQSRGNPEDPNGRTTVNGLRS